MFTFSRKLLFISILVIFLNSCSTDSSDSSFSENSFSVDTKYNYDSTELETMNLINEYRKSKGLNQLEKINYISFKSEEHNFYMIKNNVFDHNDFVARSENIIKMIGAKSVGENIAINYNSPKSVLTAWLNSPTHKENIEGNYSHFGIAIKINPNTGIKYYTNIFVKL